MHTQAHAIDWSQLWYPGPKRAFTAEEMARAGSDAPSPTLVTIAGINAALMGFAALQLAPPSQTARVTGLLAALALLGWTAARWLWRRPWRKPLMQVWGVLIATQLLFGLGLRCCMGSVPERLAVHWVLVTCVLMLSVMLWSLVVWTSRSARAARARGRTLLADRASAHPCVPQSGQLRPPAAPACVVTVSKDRCAEPVRWVWMGGMPAECCLSLCSCIPPCPPFRFRASTSSTATPN